MPQKNRLTGFSTASLIFGAVDALLPPQFPDYADLHPPRGLSYGAFTVRPQRGNSALIGIDHGF